MRESVNDLKKTLIPNFILLSPFLHNLPPLFSLTQILNHLAAAPQLAHLSNYSKLPLEAVVKLPFEATITVKLLNDRRWPCREGGHSTYINSSVVT